MNSLLLFTEDMILSLENLLNLLWCLHDQSVGKIVHFKNPLHGTARFNEVANCRCH